MDWSFWQSNPNKLLPKTKIHLQFAQHDRQSLKLWQSVTSFPVHVIDEIQDLLYPKKPETGRSIKPEDIDWILSVQFSFIDNSLASDCSGFGYHLGALY